MSGLRDRDSADAVMSIIAMVIDLAVIWCAQMLAVWIRYSSKWIPLKEDISQYLSADSQHVFSLYHDYAIAAAIALPIYLIVFQVLKLYTRPQNGTFTAKIPRLIRACLIGGSGVLVCTGLLKNTVSYLSNAAVLFSMATVSFFVLLERAIAFHAEISVARHLKPCHRTLLLGTNFEALQFLRAVQRDPRMRTRISAICSLRDEPIAEGIPESLLFHISNLEEVVRKNKIDQLVLASHSLSHDETLRLIDFCERHLVRFSMIPDIFRMMTSKMEFQMIGNIPLVGIGSWPLDQVWNRIVKRIIDIFGAILGLALSLPFIFVSAIIIKIESPGPVFYGQERCGRRGKTFRIYKLRTMKQDAEANGKAGWTTSDDPRRTRFGSFLRRLNIDELPQFWNVLKGEMSLVGPRPERPCFVEQFTPGIEHYMWRHVSKPGLTGWAQVNGLRGDTSISERVKYDLYYLENWSLAFDFKILAMTLFAYRNAG